ncbi:aconitate hydratase 1 [Magnetospirillum sp. XM-1]|uniref:aconitate hydratase AcnA n=1 Tax=Magnetospirillum sp. XM-1 TaxID=1663591 RepID=UPI00073DFC0A|nr:aconitate hydratase AcnA [Magnetospirillum sp. XM-1]CUW39633.1 aconitate hydratase 1 [Magnetospirillum sp. XM-1]
MLPDPFGALRNLSLGHERLSRYYALAALDAVTDGPVSRLPVSIRIVLESVLRNCDGKRITEEHVRQLANWRPDAPRTQEIPFVVARIVLQDFTGVPLLCDLAAMRGVAQAFGKNPKIIEPLVPVDLVVDHSVQVDHYGEADSLDLNMRREFQRNAERYRFIKWGMQAFDTFRVVPPGIGIVHQVNLEFLARGVLEKDGITYPDTLVGTDSHTTMINALGVVGWGVGGIEAEAGMLGQPLVFLTPDVVGVHLHGRLPEGATATDLVLILTERLRRAKVVGKFVEFFGEGTRSLAVPDRATIANMAPEYGATMGFFPVDEETVRYLEATGRTDSEIEVFRAYYSAQGLFGMPMPGDIDYSEVIEFDLGSVQPSIAGPKRPQDRLNLSDMRRAFTSLFSAPAKDDGYGRPAEALGRRHRVETTAAADIGHGDVLIAAITSCTNTSNPGVMLAAGLLARKAVALGLKVGPRVKTSLAPGSRVVTEYLAKAGLLGDLESLGFGVVAYGCTTCIGNSGPLMPDLEQAIAADDLVCAAVLSGNRNFEARIHPAIKANFLMSPPLVVAFAIAGRIAIDMTQEPLGTGKDGKPVMLKDIWPSGREVADALLVATDPELYRRLYSDFVHGNPLWNDIPTQTGPAYAWETSTYIAEPPFFERFSPQPAGVGDIVGARALAIFGDSVTTDHISPAGSIAVSSPAGQYLLAHGVAAGDFNSYGARRGNHEVMMRGTFANVRIRNLMLPAKVDGSRVEGGLTLHQPEGSEMPIFDAASRYQEAGIPSIVFAGTEYGTGSSRDWAAKGPKLLGVRAVVAQSFERIHRSNLVGMGVLPLQFRDGESAASLGIAGDEEFHVRGLSGVLRPRQEVVLEIVNRQGRSRAISLQLRVDTAIELDYLSHGGILPYVLRDLLAAG